MKSQEKSQDKSISFFKLFKFATTTDIALMSVGTIAAMAAGSVLPLMTIIWGDIIDGLIGYAFVADNPDLEAGLSEKVRDGVLKLSLLGVGSFTMCFIEMTCWMLAGESQAKKIREKYYYSILTKEIAWFDKVKTGELTNHLTGSINILQAGISEKVGMIIQFTCAFLIGFLIAFIKGWELALVLSAFLPVMAGSVYITFSFIGASSNRSQKEYADAGDIAQQVFSSIKTVVAFGGEEKEILKYTEKLDRAEKKGIVGGFIDGAGTGTIFLAMFGLYALAFWYGNRLVPDQLSTGEVLTVIFSILIGAFSIGGAAPHLQAVAKATGAAVEVFETIERVSLIDPLLQSGKLLSEFSNCIEFQKVNFHYESRPEVPILVDLDIKVEKGHYVALVGASGSGKSTVIKLLERFYDPTSGSIKIDGVELRELNTQSLRQNIGLVSQEPALFDTTIKENIMFGLPNASALSTQSLDKLIEDSCRKANCWEFIQKLPNKLETHVGEAGSMLSGGQKQRIAIARTIIKNPSILLLDEATSALDTESERIVQEALEKASKNRTTIAIAHRLSTIKNADKIIVFGTGKIIETGNHVELIQKDGVYAELVRAQTLKGGDSKPTSQENITAKEVDNEIQAASPELKEGIVVLKSLKKNEVEAKYPKADFMRLLRWNKKEYFWMFLASLAAIVNGSAQPLFSLIFADILTILGTPRANEIALLFLVIAAGAFVANFIQIGLFHYCSERMTRRVREACFKALLKQEVAYFDADENSTGAVTSRLANEAGMVSGLTGPVFSATIQGLSGVLTGLLISFVSAWQIGLVMLGVLPLVGLGGYLEMQTMLKSGENTRKIYEDSTQDANDTIQNIRTVASLSKEMDFFNIFVKRIGLAHTVAKRGAFWAAAGYGFSQSTLFFSFAIAYYYASYLLKWQLYDPSDILRAIFGIIFGAMAAGQVNNFAPDAAKANLAANNVFKLLDRKSVIDVTEAVGEQREHCDGNAASTDIKFAYPTRPETEILNGLDFTADTGKTIALVGKSGCGKSTVMGLLLRWYDITAGKLTVDALAVKEWNLRSLRAFMSLVGQEPVLFNGTIRDNIAYGAIKEPQEHDIFEAAKMANIHEFIMSQPLKYDTIVGEKGGQLSGGQKQRVAIARALIRNPKILLLDEATSALDSESEVVVQEALDAAAKGRTTLVIAHRLSTIQNADKILVVENGRIAESGTHSQLVASKGIYFDLVTQQRLS